MFVLRLSVCPEFDEYSKSNQKWFIDDKTQVNIGQTLLSLQKKFCPKDPQKMSQTILGLKL